MKKKFITTIIFALCLVSLSTSVFAANIGDGNEHNNITVYNSTSNSLVAGKTIDLTDNPADVNLNIDSGKSATSTDDYKTNSKAIRIKLKSSKSITVKVTLYSTSGMIGEETKQLGTIFNTTWTFRNLTNSKTYYFIVENLGQMDVNVTGTVTD